MTSPFVGREIDLALLKGIFDKTVASESVQLVTVVGEPGLGKSRLVAELCAYVDARPELVTWRQGRCLPYGEGITFWALGEIVKAHAGILESDPPDGRHGEARRGAARRATSGRGFASGCCRCWGSRRRRRRSGRSCSRPGAGSWSRSRRCIRRCWCSRTCIGPTTRCSPSSSTWPIAPRACRC